MNFGVQNAFEMNFGVQNAFEMILSKKNPVESNSTGISSDTQSSHVVEINSALCTASKNQTGERGYPDHIALVDEFVLVMEDKHDRLKLCLRDGGEISQTVDATKNFALNGALFYALKIIDGSNYKKVFAFGNAGDRKHHVIQPIFIDAEKNITELHEVDTFKNFTAENIDAYYRRMVLKETPPEEVELKKFFATQRLCMNICAVTVLSAKPKNLWSFRRFCLRLPNVATDLTSLNLRATKSKPTAQKFLNSSKITCSAPMFAPKSKKNRCLTGSD